MHDMAIVVFFYSINAKGNVNKIIAHLPLPSTYPSYVLISASEGKLRIVPVPFIIHAKGLLTKPPCVNLFVRIVFPAPRWILYIDKLWRRSQTLIILFSNQKIPLLFCNK